jgi:hypothetical protein
MIKAVIKDRIRMTPAGKKVLQEAGKPMRRGRHIAWCWRSVSYR